ncbi:MAG: 4Fe-4S dicluster domain-containing protein [bacterium]|nr:4Fe-4S dicluster domain-containing protein [bacterium]
MSTDDGAFRRLQQHLDQQAVGFPATKSGADLRFLKQLFTAEEAALALHLSYKPLPLDQIVERAAPAFAAAQVQPLLEHMFQKGAIAWKQKDGQDHWYLMPLVVGMYEAQDGAPSPRFLAAVGAYMKSKEFGLSFLAVAPAQMRTVPINASIPVEHHVGRYDQIQDIIGSATSPFAVLRCVCREASALRKKHCTKTTREETCLAWGGMAAMVLRRKHGREVSREEALATLRQNEADGLVLQSGNAQRPEFVCGCCGCCCGMLSFHKMLPRPVDFWATNYHAVVAADACTGCGICVARCQVKAITLAGTPRMAKINPGRCIGCGLCVPTCPSHALQLAENPRQMTPPQDEEALYDTIMAKKKGRWGKLGMLLKMVLRIRQ